MRRLRKLPRFVPEGRLAAFAAYGLTVLAARYRYLAAAGCVALALLTAVVVKLRTRKMLPIAESLIPIPDP